MSDYRFLESGALRASEVATDLRALESYVPGGLVPLYTDDFNRADGAPGSNWAELSGGTWSIVSNKLVRTGGSDWIDYASAMPSADHWVEADITNASSNYVVVHARSTGIGATCYQAFLVPGASQAKIGKNSGGFAYSDVVTATFAHGDAHKLRLECEGSAQRLYVDDVLVATGSDTGITTGTGVGLNTNTGSSTFDNFAAGTF